MAKTSHITKDKPIYIGADMDLWFEMEDGVDVSTYDLEWVLRQHFDDATALITKSTGGGGITVTNGLGTGTRVVVSLADTDTIPAEPAAPLAEGEYAHTLRRTGAGHEYPLATGTAWLVLPATR